MPELLEAQVGRREHLNGVIMNVGRNAAALFLLGSDEVTEQCLLVSVRRFQCVQAELKNELSALRLGDVLDAHDGHRAFPALDRDDVDLSRELADIAATAD